MIESPLISAATAHDLTISDPSRLCWMDCRFDLKDTEAGRRNYQAGHVPGARYAHLDRDLSDPVTPGHTGRHPLPDPEDFAATLRRWGISQDTHVIAYDDGRGPFASRLWWMLHWVGHSHQSVLDGGFTQWTQLGYPRDTVTPSPAQGDFQAKVNQHLTVTAEEVRATLGSGDWGMVDCRSAHRFAGHADPMDQPAGHIPGAANLPHGDTLNAEGSFRSPEELKARLERVLGSRATEQTIAYCGSGVSSCHVILASVYAGLGLPRNYIGSWSHWITDPARPIERSVAT